MTNSQYRAPIRLGYVGCGSMAQHVHLPNYATLPQCRLLAIAERRPQLALAVARRFAVEKIYSNRVSILVAATGNRQLSWFRSTICSQSEFAQVPSGRRSTNQNARRNCLVGRRARRSRANSVRHSLGFKSVRGPVKAGMAGGFSRTPSARSSEGRTG
jgi:hypothetical protein